MRYSEVDILGVLVSPFAVFLLLAWLILLPLRRLADRVGLTRHVWHPALFVLSAFVILLSLTIILAGG